MRAQCTVADGRRSIAQNRRPPCVSPVSVGVPGQPHVSGRQREKSGRDARVPRQVQREILANDPEVRRHHRRPVLRPPAFGHVPDRVRPAQ